MPSPDPHWTALQARDATADGRFVYAVRTTGICCRPSCPARLPRRDNVTFHPGPAAARAAGFRPCKRCRPDAAPDADVKLVTRACRLLATDPPASLSALAGHLGTTPPALARTFRRLTGLTPRAYAASLRAGRARERLAAGATVTDALYEAGYNAPSRFYAAAPAELGMPPVTYRDRGRGATIRFAVAQTSLGATLVAATANGLCAVTLGDDPAALVLDFETRFGNATILPPDPRFDQLVATVLALVEAPATDHQLPLDIAGSAFQSRVWQALRRIPPGTTVTYTAIAQAIGRPTATRAVAAACAANPVAIAIPCHRVIRSDGALSGYRWGIDRKARLLALEQIACPSASPA